MKRIEFDVLFSIVDPLVGYILEFSNTVILRIFCIVWEYMSEEFRIVNFIVSFADHNIALFMQNLLRYLITKYSIIKISKCKIFNR